MPEPIGVPFSEMPPAELDAAAARFSGWIPEPVPVCASKGVTRFQHPKPPPCSTDLNEAVKLPGFRELAGRDDRWCAYFLVDGRHHGAVSDKPARAVVLAFLAVCEAKHGEVE